MGKKGDAQKRQITEKYIDKAYQKARNGANAYVKTHNNTYLDEEDFAQEAMIAFLEGRTMGFGMIDAYRSAAPLKREQVGKITTPIFWQVFEHTLIDEDATSMMDHAVLQRQLREFIAKMEPIKKDVIDRYFFKQETIETIGNAYGKSRFWVSSRIKDSIRMMQKEFCHV